MQAFFKYLDILVFVEGTIYAVDEANESLARLSMNPKHAHMEGEPVRLHTVYDPSVHVLITLLCKQESVLRPKTWTSSLCDRVIVYLLLSARFL